MNEISVLGAPNKKYRSHKGHERVKVWIAILFILYVVSFFRAFFYPVQLWAVNYKLWGPLLLIQIVLITNTHVYRGILFKKQFLWFFVFIFLNMFTCLLFREQSIFVSFRAWVSFFLILYYPLFKCLNLSSDSWEKVLFRIHQLLLIGFTLQYIFLDSGFFLFSLENGEGQLDVETRVRIRNEGMLYLGAMYSLNKAFIGDKKQLVYFLWALLIIFLKSSRMVFLMFPIASFLMYIKVCGINKKLLYIIPALAVAIAVLSTTGFVQNKIEEIVIRQEKQNLDNDDYVRVGCLNYYFEDHYINNVERFLGSGRALFYNDIGSYNLAPSKYSKLVTQNYQLYHWFTEDWGLLGLLWEAGVPFMVAFFWLIISIIKFKVPREYQYIGYWELFSLLVGLTYEVIYMHEHFIYQALALVIIDRVRIEQIKGHKL